MASPIDLVTLAQAQAYIGPAATGNDAKVASLITAVSMAIERQTDATILPKTFTETRDGNPRGIMLRNWPVISIQSVTVGPFGFSGPMILQPSVGGALGYLIDMPDDPQAGTPQMLTFPAGGVCKGSSNVTVTYKAGYQTSGEAASVPPGGGTVTAIAPNGAWGSDQGVSYGAGGPLQAVAAGSEAKGAYSVSAGIYTFAPADAGAAVLLSYGYVPADLANACLEWIADRLAYQSRVGMATKSLGGQETASFKITSVPDFVKAILSNYANVVPVT